MLYTSSHTWRTIAPSCRGEVAAGATLYPGLEGPGRAASVAKKNVPAEGNQEHVSIKICRAT